MAINPYYDSLDVLKKLEKFYEKNSLESKLADVPEKNLAIYLVQLEVDKLSEEV